MLSYVPVAGVTPLMGGALDFAGGTVVHISSGVSALICALVIGKRVGFGHEEMRPHNLTYTALGAAMLWVGWFGFNAGSELASDTSGLQRVLRRRISPPPRAALAWAVLRLAHSRQADRARHGFRHRRRPGVHHAGRRVRESDAGHCSWAPSPALVCAFACSKIKATFGYDDSLDAFGVHGVGGTLGAILTGVFATRAAWDIGGLNGASGTKLGLLEGGTVLKGQIAAVVVTWVFSIVATFIILKIVDVVVGLRVSAQEETRGLDITQHEEEGYIFV